MLIVFVTDSEIAVGAADQKERTTVTEQTFRVTFPCYLPDMSNFHTVMRKNTLTDSVVDVVGSAAETVSALDFAQMFRAAFPY